MNHDVKQRIFSDLKVQGDEERAKQVAGYMKTSDLRFFGVSLPDIKKTVKKNIKEIPLEYLISPMKELWNESVFECRRAAIDIMDVYTRKGDIQKAVCIISDFIDDVDTWALMDPLGSPCLGTLLRRDTSIESVFKRWAESENFWRRRASIIPYLNLALKANYREEYAPMILDALKPHLSDSEFFVAKAVGWVLRELSKRSPEIVRGFINENEVIMTKLAIREGSKKL